MALQGKLPAEALDMIDFSVPRQEDPFEIDLSCLPSVHKTDSWEPLACFAHQTTVGESFAMSASNLSDQESYAMLAGASSMHESRESRSCRTDSRPVSHCDEEDAKPSVSKTSSSKSAHHSSGKSDSEVKKKDRTSSGSRSHSSQRHSRTSQGGMGSCRSKSLKAYRSSSRSRSPQVEDVQGNTPLNIKGCINIKAKGQVQSLDQVHTQVQCRGQNQSSVIQGSLGKSYEEKEIRLFDIGFKVKVS